MEDATRDRGRGRKGCGCNDTKVSAMRPEQINLSQDTDHDEHRSLCLSLSGSPHISNLENGGCAHIPLTRTPPLKSALEGSDSAFPLPLAVRLEVWLSGGGVVGEEISGRS